MSGTDPSLVYLDTCVILSWIKGNGSRTAAELSDLGGVIQALDGKKLTALTSVITRTEILAVDMNDDALSKYRKFMRKRRGLYEVDVNRTIAIKASEIRDHYRRNPLNPDSTKTVSTPDAIHLASAIEYGAESFFTYDQNNKGKGLGLLPLNEDSGVDGLEIRKPSLMQARIS